MINRKIEPTPDKDLLNDISECCTKQTLSGYKDLKGLRSCRNGKIHEYEKLDILKLMMYHSVYPTYLMI